MFIFTSMNFINHISGFFQKRRWLLHVIFWVTLLFSGVPKDLLVHRVTFIESITMDSCIIVSQILLSYFLGYYVIPKFFLNKKYVAGFILLIIGTYILSVLARVLVVHVGETLVRKPPFTQEPILEIITDIQALVFRYVPTIYSVVFIFVFIKYFIGYKEVREKDLLFDKEKSEIELKTLKAQLNPHFLFNTLNNIYSLSIINSPKTSVSIGKLSEILDHILYKSDDKFVSLSNEVELINNYIELEKLRYDDRLKVTVTTAIENDIEVPPLILLSLVENAFKHGAGEDSGSPEIDISVEVKESKLRFKTANSVSKDYQSNSKENIGLSNIRKQLDLIYEDKYDLKINFQNNRFEVILETL